jgi:Flp pilus assembly protein TadG
MERRSGTPMGFLSRRKGGLATQAHQRRFFTCGEEGSAIVETAFSVALLLVIVFGIAEISLALYSYHFISEAAREATRYAIVRGSSCAGFPSACPATAANIQNYVENLGYPGIDPDNMTVTTAWSPYPAGTACTPSASCNNPGNQVQVTVQYQLPLTIPFLPSRTATMSSTSQMVISQ